MALSITCWVKRSAVAIFADESAEITTCNGSSARASLSLPSLTEPFPRMANFAPLSSCNCRRCCLWARRSPKVDVGMFARGDVGFPRFFGPLVVHWRVVEPNRPNGVFHKRVSFFSSDAIRQACRVFVLLPIWSYCGGGEGSRRKFGTLAEGSVASTDVPGRTRRRIPRSLRCEKSAGMRRSVPGSSGQ